MLIQHIALVPEHERLDRSELARISAALQKQVIRDLGPLWGVSATVDAFLRLEDVPCAYWPIIVTDRDLGGRSGVHLDRNGQPFAQVEASATWSLDASRACLEMLINPYERRTISAPSLRPDQGDVEFLVEVAGACEDARYSYRIDDVLVADFCTPLFFAARALRSARYSFTDAVSAPLQLLPGGHLTWYDAAADSWWLRSHRGANPIDTELGTIERKVASLRELVLACAPLRASALTLEREAVTHAQPAQRASRHRAQRLRALLDRTLDADLKRAFEALQSAPAAEAEHTREDRDQDSSLEILDDEDVVTLGGDERAAPAVTAGPRRSTVRPPMPHATRTSSAPQPVFGLPWAEPRLDTLSIAPIARTLPPRAEPRTPVRAGALLVGGAVAGAALAVLTFGARGPAPQPSPMRASVASVASVSAPVTSALTPAIVAPLAAAAAPDASAVPEPLAAASVPSAPKPRERATKPQPAVAAPRPVKIVRRDLPSPHSEPESARATAESVRAAVIADPLDALISTRH